MSESGTLTALSAPDVAAWLEAHPDFLADYPQLAERLTVPRQAGGAASLAGYQLELLRQRNQALERRLHELAANAQANEQLSLRTHQLCLVLMAQTGPGAVLQAMVAGLAEDFAGDRVAIVLFAPTADGFSAPWLQVVPPGEARLAPLAGLLDQPGPQCGRQPPGRNRLLFGEDADSVQSSVLVPMPGVGLLAIGSSDPNRFWPGMGTVFVSMMGQALSAALARFAA